MTPVASISLSSLLEDNHARPLGSATTNRNSGSVDDHHRQIHAYSLSRLLVAKAYQLPIATGGQEPILELRRAAIVLANRLYPKAPELWGQGVGVSHLLADLGDAISRCERRQTLDDACLRQLQSLYGDLARRIR